MDRRISAVAVVMSIDPACAAAFDECSCGAQRNPAGATIGLCAAASNDDGRRLAHPAFAGSHCDGDRSWHDCDVRRAQRISFRCAELMATSRAAERAWVARPR